MVQMVKEKFREKADFLPTRKLVGFPILLPATHILVLGLSLSKDFAHPVNPDLEHSWDISFLFIPSVLS